MKTEKRFAIIFALMAVVLLILVRVSIALGTVQMTRGEIWAILMGNGRDEMNRNIILNIRLPRILAAVILGGALALSGYLLQTFFHNPIAGPFVLGISSGAKLFVALAMIGLMSRGIQTTSIMLVAAAFAGAMAAMGFVLVISLRVSRMSILIVCGILIGYICSAVTDFTVTFADESNIVNLHNWSMGSFSGISWNDIRIMSVIVAFCFLSILLLSKPIGAYRIGEAYARSLGVNIRLLRTALICLSSFLAACVTAFAGPVSFVGIAVPHLIRRMFRTSKPLVMIPACFLGGAFGTLLCDGIARIAFAPAELSIGSVTAVLLAPVVIIMMIKTSSRRSL